MAIEGECDPLVVTSGDGPKCHIVSLADRERMERRIC